MTSTMETVGGHRRTYLPAAGRDWLLPLYDPLVKLLGGDRAHQTLLEQSAIRPGQRVLDVGCGTGSLVILVKQLHPEVEVVGLDPDPKALARARRKAERAKASIRFDSGFSDELPYPDASFDLVFSSFMFHHLPQGEKTSTLREIRRILRPGGFLHLLDFAVPHSGTEGFFSRLLHSTHHLKDNSEDQILALMTEAGFEDSKTVARGSMLFGRTAYFEAAAPTAAGAPAGSTRRDELS